MSLFPKKWSIPLKHMVCAEDEIGELVKWEGWEKVSS